MFDTESIDFDISLFIQIPFWSRTVQEYSNNKPKKTHHNTSDVKDWFLNIIANDVALADDLADIKPHTHLSGHQPIQQSFLRGGGGGKKGKHKLYCTSFCYIFKTIIL